MEEPERLIDKDNLIELEGIEPGEIDEIEINIPEETIEDELEEIPVLAEESLEELSEAPVPEESEAAITELTAEESLEEFPPLDDLENLEELEDSGPADIVEEVPAEIPGEPELVDIDLELPEEELTLEEETVAEAPVPEDTIEDELEEIPVFTEESLEELSEAPVPEESEAAIAELTAEDSMEGITLLDDLEELEELEDSGPEEMLEEVPTEIAGEADLADIELELPEEELTLEEKTIAEAPVPEETIEDELEEIPVEIEEAALPEGFSTHDAASAAPETQNLPDDLRSDIKSVLSYLDQLLESLPEEKIREFADSEFFGIYKKLFEDLGLGT